MEIRSLMIPAESPEAGRGRSTMVQAQERVVEIRIQGNTRTPEDDIRRIAGIAVGDVITDATLTDVRSRLDRSGRFDDVEIRKRWRTIDSTEDIVLVIVVREVPGGSTNPIGRAGRALTHPLVLPILDYADGYGLTYGARLSPVNLLGEKLHVSIPLSWGANREAGLELDRSFAAGPLTRVTSSLAIAQRDNPFYDLDDKRLTLSGRAERAFGRYARAGLSGGLSDVAFGDDEERLATWGADISFDSRRNTELPRNAMWVQAGWERLQPESGAVDRYRVDARGFIGLPRGSLVALRAVRAAAADALPRYEQFLLGGSGSVRGFRPGYDAGDELLLGSAEWRIPLTSPVSFGRIGACLFVDTGRVYAVEERLSDGRFRTGAGAGLFFNAAIFNLNLDLARGLDRGWRLHVSSGFQF
jgi:hypothetical protein